MQRHLSVLGTLFVLSVGGVEAQSAALAAPLQSPSATVPAAAGVELFSSAASTAFAREGSRGVRSVVYGAVGSLVGAGAGFLVSQVVHSDWDKTTNSTFASHRRRFALSGAAVGVVAAVLASRSDPYGQPAFPRGDRVSREGSGGAIRLVELEQSSAQNAYEAVASLRPQWLVVRGATLGSFGTLVGSEGDEGAQAGPGRFVTIPGEGRIGAFLDGMPLENLEALRSIPIIGIERIEFRSASVGGSGPGHVQRAIVVISASARTQ